MYDRWGCRGNIVGFGVFICVGVMIGVVFWYELEFLEGKEEEYMVFKDEGDY